jgi:GTP-binding protein
MVIKQAEFITSAAKAEQFIVPQKPMIAICGKSNVGKSSLINMLANRKNLAKTSATPGRTRLVNYFDFGEFILADLPGYGYAEVSKAEQEKWAKTLDDFFKKGTGDISHVLVLIDIRHGATEDDMQLIQMLNYYILPFTVVFTKADKLSRMKAGEHAKKIADSMGLTKLNTVTTSSEKRTGREELLEKIENIIALAKVGTKEKDDDQ